MRMRWLDSITDSMDMNLSKPWEILKKRWTWCPAVHGVTKIWKRLSDWTTTTTEFPVVGHLGFSAWNTTAENILSCQFLCVKCTHPLQLMFSHHLAANSFPCLGDNFGLAKKFIWVFLQDPREWVVQRTRRPVSSLLASPVHSWEHWQGWGGRSTSFGGQRDSCSGPHYTTYEWSH